MKETINIISDILGEDGMGFVTSPSGTVTGFCKNMTFLLVQSNNIDSAKSKLYSLRDYHIKRFNL